MIAVPILTATIDTAASFDAAFFSEAFVAWTGLVAADNFMAAHYPCALTQSGAPTLKNRSRLNIERLAILDKLNFVVRNTALQTVFNIVGGLTILTGLALVGSFGLGFLTGSDTIRIANGELTMTANILDRILLVVFLILLLATFMIWQELRKG